MADANRSLSACLRCRRQKLKCGGPGRVPCQRCRASNAECIFVAPRASQVRETSSRANDVDEGDKFTRLEQRLKLVETELRAEIEELKRAIIPSSQTGDAYPPVTRGQGPFAPSTHLAQPPAESFSESPELHESDIVARGIVTEEDWSALHSFFHNNCRAVIGFLDDMVYPPARKLRRHPLLSTVVCSIAARAIRPGLYRYLVAEADRLIKDTFQGPTPDLLSEIAMMALTGWTGRARLWGYVTSIAGELKLNEAALQLGEDTTEQTEEIVERARTWFTLCCFDLQMNLTRPFAINKMKEYFPYAKRLLSSPYSRPVDYRICATLDGYSITGDAKAQLRSSQLLAQPLSEEIANLLTSFDERVDDWFHEINNRVEPLYQTFSEQQDRNRFMIPYSYMKLYINGIAIHGLDNSDGSVDVSRLGFVRAALDSASLLIQTIYESEKFRRGLRYTIDYNGVSLYQASSFILKAVNLAHPHLDCGKYLTTLRKAAQMFDEAGSSDAAMEIRQEQESLAAQTHTVLSPQDYPDTDTAMHHDELFDIPSFLDDMNWTAEFPLLSTYKLA